MNLLDFMDHVQKMNKECEETLGTANKEYARDDDKFNNFEVTAYILRQINPRLAEIRSEDIAFIFMMKHLFSIAKGVSLREPMRGRFKDCHNYLHLIHGIHEDMKDSHEKLDQGVDEVLSRLRDL
jgi:hypothetical protein